MDKGTGEMKIFLSCPKTNAVKRNFTTNILKFIDEKVHALYD